MPQLIRPQPRNLSEQLDLDEGRSRFAYYDSEHLLTIGKGRLCDPSRPRSGLNDAEIEYLFNNDLARTLSEAVVRIPWIYELDKVRQDAILNMCFQMGADGVAKFQRALAALRAKDYSLCGSELRASIWHSQTPARAERIIQQILTGIYQ